MLTLSALAEAAPKRLILIGTGTGMAPYRAMLPELLVREEQGTEIHLLMGTRQPQDLFFHHEFRSCAAVTFESCLSRASNPDSAKGEYTGYVQERLMQLDPRPEQDVVYLCGNPAMVDDCIKLLTERGFGPRSIKREKYTFSR